MWGQCMSPFRNTYLFLRLPSGTIHKSDRQLQTMSPIHKSESQVQYMSPIHNSGGAGGEGGDERPENWSFDLRANTSQQNSSC